MILASLLNSAPSYLRALPITDTCLTRLCASSIINMPLTCLYLHQQAPYAPLSCLVTNTVVSVGSMVKNDHGHTKRCEFSVLDGKHLCKFASQNQNCQSKLKYRYPDQFKHAEFNGDVHFFCFRPEMPFLGKLGPKNQNCQCELKFSTYTNLNMQIQWWSSIFLFSTENTFFGAIWSKN